MLNNDLTIIGEQTQKISDTKGQSQSSSENQTRRSTPNRSKTHKVTYDDKVEVEVHNLKKIAYLLTKNVKSSAKHSIIASACIGGVISFIIEAIKLYPYDNVASLKSLIIYLIACFCCLFVFSFCIKAIKKQKNDVNQIFDNIKDIIIEINDRSGYVIFPQKEQKVDWNKLYDEENKKEKKEFSLISRLRKHHILLFLMVITFPYQALSKTNSDFNFSNSYIGTLSIVGTVLGAIASCSSLYALMLYRRQNQKLIEEKRKTKAQIINPTLKSERLVQEGTTALDEGNFHTAVKKYSEAIILDPNKPEIYEMRADAYNQLGNINQSLEDYERSLHFYSDNTSNHIQILHKIANLHYYAGGIIESEIYYNKALDAIEKINPKKKDTLSNEIVQIINDYASLLIEQNNYSKADYLLSKAHVLLQSDISGNPDLLAMTLNNAAIVYKETNQYLSAEKYYTEALSIYRKLLEKDPNTHLPDVAMMLNNLANLHSDTNQYKEAEVEYHEALTTYLQLAAQKPDAYLPDVAMTLNNLAALHYSINQYKEAEEEYNEALTIRRQLADKNPDAFLPNVAQTLNNLANLHSNTSRLQEAEEEYNEALTTYRKLADQHPDAYLLDVAMTLNNLAILHSDTNQLDKAEEEYNEALTTYRQLAAQNRDAYLPDVAMTLNNLANLHYSTNRYTEAEEEYNEALTIRRQLADKNPDAFLPYVAMTLNNLGLLHSDTNQLDKAEEEYNEALTIRRQLADKNPDAYLPDVADTLENLANLHSDTDRLQDAEEVYKDVLSIRQKLADKNPDAYLHKVAQTLFNMALLHLARKEYPAAETAAQESLEKYRIMAEKSHAAFDPKVKKGEVLLEVIRKAKEADA